MGRRPPEKHSAARVPGIFDISDRAAMDILRNPSAGGLFEVIRRFSRGVQQEDLGAATGLPMHQVRMLVEQLASIGLVRVKRARRGGAHRLHAACQQVTILSDPAVQEEIAEVRRHFRDATADAARELRAAVQRDRSPAPFARDGHFWLDSLVKFELSKEEWVAFSRLLWQVFDHLASRASSRTATRPADVRPCDHVLAITIVPTTRPLLPGPVIRSNRRPVRPGDGGDRLPDGVATLTTREGTVAFMIAAGTTRRDIAKRLGLSENTVATFAKRAYAKLGVHSRRELVHRLARPTMHDSPD
jgi:DNA-binding CsgD family transcriptional regulator